MRPVIPPDLVFNPTLASWKFSFMITTPSLGSNRLDLLLGRTMIVLRFLAELTWIALPATGINFQPQTRDNWIVPEMI